MCVDGEASFTYENETETIKMGETILVPASMKKIKLSSKKADLLEVFIK